MVNSFGEQPAVTVPATRSIDVTCPVCHAPAGVRCERVVGDPALDITSHLKRATEAARRTREANERARGGK